MEVGIIKILSLLKWLLYPIAALIFHRNTENFGAWVEENTQKIIGGTIGTVSGGVEAVKTLQEATIAGQLWLQFAMIVIAAIKAMVIVIASLWVTDVYQRRKVKIKAEIKDQPDSQGPTI